MIQEIRDALNGTYQRRARNNAITGLTAGLLIGAIAGILFAPKSGKETRADIREGAIVGAEKVKETAQHLGATAKVKAAHFSEVAKERVSELKEHMKTGKKAAQAGAEAAEAVVEEAQAESAEA